MVAKKKKSKRVKGKVRNMTEGESDSAIELGPVIDVEEEKEKNKNAIKLKEDASGTFSAVDKDAAKGIKKLTEQITEGGEELLTVPPLPEGHENLKEHGDTIFDRESNDVPQALVPLLPGEVLDPDPEVPLKKLSEEGLVKDGDFLPPDPEARYAFMDEFKLSGYDSNALPDTPLTTIPESKGVTDKLLGTADKIGDWIKDKRRPVESSRVNDYYASLGGYTGPLPSEVEAKKDIIDAQIGQLEEELNNIPDKIRNLQNEIYELENKRAHEMNSLKGRPDNAYDIRLTVSRIDRDIKSKQDEITKLQKREGTIKTDILKQKNDKITLDSVSERYRNAITKGKIVDQKEKDKLAREERKSMAGRKQHNFSGSGELNSILSGSKINIGKNMNDVIGTGVGARGRSVTDVVGVKKGGAPLSSAIAPVRGQKLSVLDEGDPLSRFGKKVSPVVSVRELGSSNRQSSLEMLGVIKPDVPQQQGYFQQPQQNVPRHQSSLEMLGVIKPNVPQQPVYQQMPQGGMMMAQQTARKAKRGKKQSVTVDRKKTSEKGIVANVKKSVIKNPTKDVRKTSLNIQQNFTIPKIHAKGLSKFDGLKIKPTKFDLGKKIKI